MLLLLHAVCTITFVFDFVSIASCCDHEKVEEMQLSCKAEETHC